MRALAAGALLAMACTSFPADRDYSFGVNRATGITIDQVPVRGFPAYLTFFNEGSSSWGELLAVDERSVWIEIDGTAQQHPLAKLESVTIKAMEPKDLTGVGLWAGLGTLANGGVGLWSMFAAPAYVVIAIPVVIQAALDNRLRIRPKNFVFLRQYARYPQGLPR